MKDRKCNLCHSRQKKRLLPFEEGQYRFGSFFVRVGTRLRLSPLEVRAVVVDALGCLMNVLCNFLIGIPESMSGRRQGLPLNLFCKNEELRPELGGLNFLCKRNSENLLIVICVL